VRYGGVVVVVVVVLTSLVVEVVRWDVVVVSRVVDVVD